MDAKVPVPMMVAAIRDCDELNTAAQNAICDYILAAESQIAETERMLREEWWLNHRCPISALYGDDGEMQCNAACCRKDFKSAPIGELSAHVRQRRLTAATADMTLLEEARAEIAEMRKELLAIAAQCGCGPYACDDCEHKRAQRAADIGLTEANDEG